MYTQNIASAIKNDKSMNSETLPWKTIISKLDLLKKATIIQ